MWTLRVRLFHRHNLEEIIRIVGRQPVRQEPEGRYFFEIGKHEEAHLMVIRLNALYGVQAKLLEIGDADC